MVSWRERGRGGNALDGGGVNNSSDADVSLPHGPGEWDEALGLPLCVVCQNVRMPGGNHVEISLTPSSPIKLKLWSGTDRGKRMSLILFYNFCEQFY